MAGLGKKTFTAGEVLTAADVNGYLMEQSVMVFGGTAARSSAIPTPSEGMVTYLSDLNDIQAYDGSSWISTGLTAGTTTANYGWPIPASGSIASLGTAIDTTVAGLGSGLVHINTSTVTTQSSLIVDNVFSSTYDNYLIIGNLTAASGTDVDVNFYLRTGGTDATTNYNSERLRHVTTNVGSGGASSGRLAQVTSAYPTYCTFVCTMRNPFLAQLTTYNTHSTFTENAGSFYDIIIGGYHGLTTSYSGIKFLPSSGTFSGTFRIYGYQNS